MSPPSRARRLDCALALRVRVQAGSQVIGLLACADQRHALTAGSDGTVKCWDTLAGRGVCTYKRPAGVFPSAPVLSADDRSGPHVRVVCHRMPHLLCPHALAT